jgi:hypothetical protein
LTREGGFAVTDENTVLEPDDPPKSGMWVDSEDDVLAQPTEAELEAGKRLGEVIDTDDDEDTGL